MIWLYYIFQNRESQRIVNMSDERKITVSNKYVFIIDDYFIINVL